MNTAVFIDRDGVINLEVKHPEIKDKEGRICTDPLNAEEFILFDGVKEAFQIFKEINIPTIVLSNQAGFAKGFFDQTVLEAVKNKLKSEVNPAGIYYCTHHQDYTGPCECKKPKKGLLLQAARDHQIDINNSYMVGDRRIDMQMGSDCRKCFYVDSRVGENAQEEVAKLDPELQKKVIVVKDLLEAALKIKEDLKIKDNLN